MISRKKFLTASALAAISSYKAFDVLASSIPHSTSPTCFASDPKICIFSKCLQWLKYTDLAEFAADAGFDGIDLTVRKNGHVLPENVVKDLPKAVKAVEDGGLKVYMITTDIADIHEPHTAAIIQTAARLGIKYYRTNWYNYDSAISIPANIEVFKRRLAGLSKLNRQYNVEGVYQNHAGHYFGASVWDLWLAIKDLESISCQYDIRHATVEGTSSWETGFELIHQKINTIAVKDFTWQQQGTKWNAKSVPLGEGIVDYTAYLKMVDKYRISGPASMHFEYPLGGAEEGARTITLSREDFKKAIIKDLRTFQKLIA